MAGLADSPTAIAAKPQLAPARAMFSNQKLVDASVSMGGRSFTTMIREGASAEELIEKVAKENGGGVAKVYYPQFDTWEIVAVKIGGELLVKGDPKRVAEADFSAFSEPERTKSAAIDASRHSDGGIHFSLGAAGIPIAMTQDRGVVFPNAEELRVGSSTRNIALWMTGASFDPMTLSDLDRTYKGLGGVSVSPDALQRIASAHGGARSDKLMLEDNLLVLNKDTGEILTASQFSAPMMRDISPAQAFEYRMEAQAGAPAQNKIPIEMRTPPAMLDGWAVRWPLVEPVAAFSARTFERSIMELLTVRFNPLRESVIGERMPLRASRRFLAREAEAPSLALLDFAPGPEPKEAGGRQGRSPVADAPPKKNPERNEEKRPLSANKPNEERSVPKPQLTAPPLPAIIEAWARLRTEKAGLGIPSSVRTLKDAVPDMTQREKTFKKGKDTAPRIAKTKEHPDSRKTKGAPKIAAERRIPPANTGKGGPKAENAAKKKPLIRAPAAGMKPGASAFLSKPKRAKAEKAAHGYHMPNPPARSKKTPIPALLARQSRIPSPRTRVKRERNVGGGETTHLRVQGGAPKKDTGGKRRRSRKIDHYLFNQLVGIFRRKSRKRLSGRTAAGN